MSLLKELQKMTMLKEGRVKDLMMDLIEKAAKQVSNTGDTDKYVMTVVAKVLELDHNNMFAGNAVECEAMVRGTLGLDED